MLIGFEPGIVVEGVGIGSVGEASNSEIPVLKYRVGSKVAGPLPGMGPMHEPWGAVGV